MTGLPRASDDPPIEVRHVDIRIVPGDLPYAAKNRAAIEAAWAATQAVNPSLYNGGFFLFERASIDGDTFHAEGRQVDYATFLHWRADGFPDQGILHIFPVGALVTQDRRIIVGAMAHGSTNAGAIYPPSGSFDPHDIVEADGAQHLDAVGNIVRELHEETGLAVPREEVGHSWLVFSNGSNRLALVSLIEMAEPARDLVGRLEQAIGAQPHPELSFVRAVDHRPDVDEARFAAYVRPLIETLHKHDRRAGHLPTA